MKIVAIKYSDTRNPLYLSAILAIKKHLRTHIIVYLSYGIGSSEHIEYMYKAFIKYC